MKKYNVWKSVDDIETSRLRIQLFQSRRWSLHPAQSLCIILLARRKWEPEHFVKIVNCSPHAITTLTRPLEGNLYFCYMKVHHWIPSFSLTYTHCLEVQETEHSLAFFNRGRILCSCHTQHRLSSLHSGTCCLWLIRSLKHFPRLLFML